MEESEYQILGVEPMLLIHFEKQLGDQVDWCLTLIPTLRRMRQVDLYECQERPCANSILPKKRKEKNQCGLFTLKISRLWPSPVSWRPVCASFCLDLPHRHTNNTIYWGWPIQLLDLFIIKTGAVAASGERREGCDCQSVQSMWSKYCQANPQTPPSTP